MDDAFDLEPCVAHVWDVVNSDGRSVCSECGAVRPRHEDPEDCLDCGMCEDCIDRTIAAADEFDMGENGAW